MIKLPTICAAALLMLAASPASAQSFNCGYAKLPSEVAICQSPQLGYLDQVMAQRYFYLTNTLPGVVGGILRSDQAAWLQSRNTCGYDFACLNASIGGRISQMCGSIYAGYPVPPCY